jgi:hypothetical protein
MDNAERTMIENIEKKFGRSFEEWIKIVKQANLEKHGYILNMLRYFHEKLTQTLTIAVLRSTPRPTPA